MNRPIQRILIWDLEYLHDGVMAELHGENWFEASTSAQQPAAVDVNAILSYASSGGEIVSNRVYADWRFMRAYADIFRDTDADLLQIFSDSGSVEEELARRVRRDVDRSLHLHPRVDHLYVIGGSSALLGATGRARNQRIELRTIVSGLKSDASWESACDVVLSHNKLDAVPQSTVSAPTPADSNRTVHQYRRVASQQGLRLPPTPAMWFGVNTYGAFVEADRRFADFNALDEVTLHALEDHFGSATLTDAKKIRQVLFKCFIFRPAINDEIGFQDEIKDVAGVRYRYFDLMLHRIAEKLNGPVDYEALSLTLTDSADWADELREQHAAMRD